MSLLDRLKGKQAAVVQIPASFPLDWLLDPNWSVGFFGVAHDKAVGIADKDGVFLAVGVLATYVTATESGEVDLIFMGRGIKYSGAHPWEAQYTPTGRFSTGSIVYVSRSLFLRRIGEIGRTMAAEGTRAWEGFNQFSATIEGSRRFLYE